MHVCTYTHLYIHIYFTACGPPKHLSFEKCRIKYFSKSIKNNKIRYATLKK